jgi:restriction system protein
MWVVRLVHPTVNKFRVIAEHTREAAEQEAAKQIKAWDAEFSAIIATASAVARGEKRWLDPKAMKRLLSPEHRLRELAEQLTAQVQAESTALGFLLKFGALLKYTVQWGPLSAPALDKLDPVPAEPSNESYKPHISFLGRIIPSIRERERNKAEDRFKAAHTQWERSTAEIEARNQDRRESFQRELSHWQAAKSGVKAAYSRREPSAVAEYCRTVLNASVYPRTSASVPRIALHRPFSADITATEHPDPFPKTLALDYAGETRTVVVDYELPAREAMPSAKGYKHVAAGDKVIPITLSQTSTEETYDSVLYQVALRTIYELLRWDEAGALDSVVFNGWVTSTDKATGQSVHPCVLTIQATKREFLEINVAEVDPKACFRKLKGISGARLAAMSPVRPILQLNREDARFISARPVMDALDNSTNLAAMDWEDFEQLIRDVFEKEFSGDGGEVKITRASRDHGVDAVAFDPDPIRGGKIVIQAKRYTDTVSVSAVRDLYGTILNEGANKGILVTTADYGPDAYEFAKGKPITLLNGSELLYLLQKHGHKARIDLAQARMLAAEKEKERTRATR